MNIKDNFTLRTVRKKIIMVSKTAGIVLIISYVVSTRLPIHPDVSFWIWLCFVTALVLVVDYLMGRFISNPVSELSRAARQMAQLDFSSPCKINTNDEFGELSENLNKMSQNLQQALSQLQTANAQLEKDVEQERLLLMERKELVDSLSHEMKTPLGVIRAYAEGVQDEPDEAKRQMVGIVYIKIIMILFLAPPIFFYLTVPNNSIIFRLSYLLPSSATFYGVMDLLKGKTEEIIPVLLVLLIHAVLWSIVYKLVRKKSV